MGHLYKFNQLSAHRPKSPSEFTDMRPLINKLLQESLKSDIGHVRYVTCYQVIEVRVAHTSQPTENLTS